MIRAYEDRDFEEISYWVLAREKRVLFKNSLPRVGLVKEGIACGFIHFTGTNTFFLEAFASNPDASLYARGKAIYSITMQLIDLAKQMGASRCVALTNELCFIKRLHKLGFSMQDMQMGISYFF